MNLTGISGALPSSLSLFTDLRTISLAGSSLPSIPSSLSSLSNLQSFSLSGVSLSSTIPASFSSLTSLQSFDASNNPGLSGDLPRGLISISVLTSLALATTGIIGPFPSINATTSSSRRLAATSSVSGALTSINMRSSSLNGTFPGGLYLLGSLTSIDFSNCLLSGNLPADLGQLSGSLTSLALSGNQLGGYLPSSTWSSSFYSLVVSSLTGNLLCSQELLLAPAIVPTLSVKSASALTLTWSAPSVSAAASACIRGYRITYAACSDSAAPKGCSASTAWDSTFTFVDYSPTAAATGSAGSSRWILYTAAAVNGSTTGTSANGSAVLQVASTSASVSASYSYDLYGVVPSLW